MEPNVVWIGWKVAYVELLVVFGGEFEVLNAGYFYNVSQSVKTYPPVKILSGLKHYQLSRAAWLILLLFSKPPSSDGILYATNDYYRW